MDQYDRQTDAVEFTAEMKTKRNLVLQEVADNTLNAKRIVQFTEQLQPGEITGSLYL